MTWRVHRGGVAQLVRALPCHGRGYGFEPRRSRQSSFGAPVAFAVLRRTKAENEDWLRAVTKRRRALTLLGVRRSELRLGKPVQNGFCLRLHPPKPSRPRTFLHRADRRPPRPTPPSQCRGGTPSIGHGTSK